MTWIPNYTVALLQLLRLISLLRVFRAIMGCSEKSFFLLQLSSRTPVYTDFCVVSVMVVSFPRQVWYRFTYPGRTEGLDEKSGPNTLKRRAHDSRRLIRLRRHAPCLRDSIQKLELIADTQKKTQTVWCSRNFGVVFAITFLIFDIQLTTKP